MTADRLAVAQNYAQVFLAQLNRSHEEVRRLTTVLIKGATGSGADARTVLAAASDFLDGWNELVADYMNQTNLLIERANRPLRVVS